MKNIAVLGSTGSIGTKTLDVVSELGDKFRIVALSAGANVELLREQIKRFNPLVVSIASSNDADELRRKFHNLEILTGDEGLAAIASDKRIDIVVNAVVGAAGLNPSWNAVCAGKRLCTANKESLVIAGALLTQRAKETGAQIFPIDSEHSALWQAMLSGKKSETKRLILTASGGPFWGKDIDFDKVTVEQALAHPNWAMGSKISIDSATMMNKALEIIEAHWLFDIPPECIEVVVHPQSIIHSIVEFVDNSQIAQMSLPDMRLPIQYALSYPIRFPSPISLLNLQNVKQLEFFNPDNKKFPSIQLAYRALSMGGTASATLNAANEIAVDAFLKGKIKFSRISQLVEEALTNIPVVNADSIEAILIHHDSVCRWTIERIDEDN